MSIGTHPWAESIFYSSFSCLVTNSTDPDDELAVEVGNLYVDGREKMQQELQSNLEELETSASQGVRG